MIIDPQDMSVDWYDLVEHMVSLGWRYRMSMTWGGRAEIGPRYAASFFRPRFLDEGWIQGNRSSQDFELAIRVAATRAHLAMFAYIADEQAYEQLVGAA